MSVFVIAQLKFVDLPRYREYMKQFADVFAKFTGTLLCADESPEILEGEWSGDKVVVMAFPNAHGARRFLESPEYNAISIDRRAGADTVALLVKGV